MADFTVMPGDAGQQILEAQLRIERKLDALIAALAEDDDHAPAFTLDGKPSGAARDTSQPL